MARIMVPQAEQWYHSLFESSLYGIDFTDMEGRYLNANPAFLKMTGYTKEELSELRYWDLTPPHCLEAEKKMYRALLKKGYTDEYERDYVRKDGSLLPVSIQAWQVKDKSHRSIGTWAIIRDISRQKHNEELVDTLYCSSPVGIYIVQDRKFRHVNPRFEEILGYNHEELLGTYPLNYVIPEDREATRASALGMLRHDNVIPCEYRVLCKSGKIKWCVEELASIQFQGKRAALGNVMDVTHHKQVEEQLVKLNTELKSVNNELESFSYSVSHDLRAPLRSIEGFSQALLEDYSGHLDPRGHDYLNRVRSSTKSMKTLIDDLLTLSRITRAPVKIEPVNLSLLARAISSELVNAQPERQIEIRITEGITGNGDTVLLRAVLSNLLDNAFKFTSKKPRANVEFNVKLAGGRQVYFVRDNGAGFNMDYVDKLFAPFQRLHSHEEFPGNGVGLATVRRIINRHGGKVWAEGKAGKGATFYFTLD